MALDEINIIELVVEDVADHAQEQRSIGTDLDGDPLIGFASRRGEVRVDADHARTGLLSLIQAASGGKRRLAEV